MPTDDQIEGETRFVSWNAKVGRNVDTVLDQLHQIIEDHDPQIICLQEFGQYTGAAKDRFGKNGTGKWFVYAHNDWTDANDGPVMVRAATHDQQKRGHGWDTVRTTTKWTGPQGGTHKGRTFTWVKTNSVYVMSVHRCWGGDGRNTAAFQEEYDALVKWGKNHDDLPVLMFGDHNCGPGATFKGASKKIADALSGKVLVPSSGGIDYAVKHDFSGTAKQTKEYGSDHEAILIVRS